MLQIRNLTITHKKDLRTITENFNLTVNAGDKAVIIGEEGNGKSTLLKLIFQPELVENYVDYTGEIIRNGMIFGYLAQELTEEDKKKTVYEYLSEESFLLLTPKEQADMGRQLKLAPDFFFSDQQLQTLSGGEKVKLQFVRILCIRPNILLLDEPSNDIDIETLEWLEEFINQCEIPVLFISHDETLIERTANMVIHIEQIRRKTKPRVTVAKMGYREYVGARQSKMTHQEQLARKERSEYRKQQEKFRQIQQKVEHQQDVITRQDPHGAALLKKTMHRVKAYEARFQKEFDNMTQLPETEEAIFIKFSKKASMPNSKIVLDYHLDELTVENRILAREINLLIKGPEHICIIGENGCGKTTFIRKIAGELLNRNDVKAAYMPQNYDEMLDMTVTPVEFLCQVGDKEEISKIRTYLGSMKYTVQEMEHSISELSGGQRAKIILLKMSMSGCNVLILDEPTRNFSPLSSPIIRGMLAGFSGCIISISHDRKYIQEVATKTYELTKNGLIPIFNQLQYERSGMSD